MYFFNDYGRVKFSRYQLAKVLPGQISIKKTEFPLDFHDFL